MLPMGITNWVLHPSYPSETAVISKGKKGWFRRNKNWPVASPVWIMNLLIFILNYSLIDHIESEYVVSVVYSLIYSLCILGAYTDYIYRLYLWAIVKIYTVLYSLWIVSEKIKHQQLRKQKTLQADSKHQHVYTVTCIRRNHLVLRKDSGKHFLSKQ